MIAKISIVFLRFLYWCFVNDLHREILPIPNTGLKKTLLKGCRCEILAVAVIFIR